MNLALRLDASSVRMVHVEGSTPTIDGVSHVVAEPAAIRSAVKRFLGTTSSTASVVEVSTVKDEAVRGEAA